MADLQGWVVDPLAVLSPEAREAERERRGRVAFRAWAEYKSRIGDPVPCSWDDLVLADKDAWTAVYGVCERAERDREAGV